MTEETRLGHSEALRLILLVLVILVAAYLVHEVFLAS